MEYKTKFFSLILYRHRIIDICESDYPDYWALKGWTNTIKKLNYTFDIAFFGNSLTARSDFQESFPHKTIINLGYPGDNLRGMLKRVPMLEAASPNTVFIMGGTNDLFISDLTEFENDYINLIKAIRDRVPNLTIYIQSILPMNPIMNDKISSIEKITQANKILRRISEANSIGYIDIYSEYSENGVLPLRYTNDGIYLKKDSYMEWENLLSKYINYI